MTALRASGSNSAGFTLIEMLVVLAILGAITAVALPALTRPSDGLRLAATLREMMGALRVTRSAAITRNTELVLIFDIERRTFASSTFAERSFPAQIKAELKVAEPERVSASRGGIRFFPDGSSTGGEVLLSLKGRNGKLCVHWLTGQPTQGGEC